MASSGDNFKQNLAEILTICRFYVGLQLDGSTEPVDAYFMECKGFKYSQDVLEIAEVFPQPWGKAKRGRIIRTKMPGNVKYNNISLRRGLSASETLWNWIKAVQEGNWAKQFRNGFLVIYRQDASEGARFAFERAWPISYNVSDSVISGTDLAFEELELAVETLVRVSLKSEIPVTPQSRSLPSSKDIAKSSSKDIAKSSSKDIAKPSSKNIAKPSSKDIAKPSSKDIAKPSSKNIAKLEKNKSSSKKKNK